MPNHFPVPDSVRHYEKVTAFSLISCHGVPIIKAFQSNSRLPSFWDYVMQQMTHDKLSIKVLLIFTSW